MTRGGLVESPPVASFWVTKSVTTTAAWQGGCGRFTSLPDYRDKRDQQHEQHDEVFQKLRKPHATTSPRAHPDPGLAWAVGPGRAGAPRVLFYNSTTVLALILTKQLF